ncbi:MAG: phosphatase PAP2 family protein, partial [Bacteroidetes bacterium]|nr:phosphatase PAP2 family protein [Bacteroidota bacterium]
MKYPSCPGKLPITIIYLSLLTIFQPSSPTQAQIPEDSAQSFYWIWHETPKAIFPAKECPPQNKVDTRLRLKIKEHQDLLRFWETGPPFYRWQQLMSSLGGSYPHRRNGGRMAHFFGSIYDAIQKTKTLAPDSIFRPILRLPKSQHLHYQLSLITTAETARKVLRFYFPEGEKEIESLYKKHRKFIGRLEVDSCRARKARAIGRRIANTAIQRSKKDRTRNFREITFKNKNNGHWYGTPSAKDYAKRQWRPFVLDSPSQFRCEPPPSSWEKDMEELRQFNLNNSHSDIAWKWKSIPVWDQWLDQLMFEYQLDLRPLRAAFIYATFHITRYEATLSAWEAKYHYMGIRPFQYDTSFAPLLVHTPNFPGYPAGHTTVAGALAEVISHFFPEEKQDAIELAEECSESRFEGGVHFRTDNEVGLQQGKRVGQAVL